MDDVDIDRFKELTAYGLIQVLQTEEGIPVIYIPTLDQYFLKWSTKTGHSFRVFPEQSL
ncbi:hypothetical protein QE443_000359 [Pantoea ananatis]|uniref:hypothetical protein n=1 Tax=Pantoea ananas TaxID=553 RepID=UPI002781DDF3|nr:hypothetical protein [Pantoea ananatis]MDQ1224198.1 hypothetical protein [Pantoea ananatis]MDR6092703.1 hypothetical protein [Pantoea ananatis]